MSIFPILFLFVFVIGSVCGLMYGPFWSLLTYVFVYFNIPSHQWWSDQLPSLRWSLIAAVILITSCIIHKNKLNFDRIKGNKSLNYLTLLLFIMFIVSTIGYQPEASLIKSYEFFRYVLVYILIILIITNIEEYKLFVLTLIACTLNISLLARHSFTGDRLDGVGLADASDANMLAALVLLILPLVVSVTFTGNKFTRIISILSAPFILNAFAMCRSRGGFIGLIVQGVLAAFLLRNRVGKMKLLFCGAILCGLSFSLMDSAYLSRILGMSKQVSEDALAEASAGRTEVWKYGLNIAKDFPFGAGSGAFMELSPHYFSFDKIGGKVKASHNTYLMLLVEQSILGLTIYLMFIITTIQLLHKIRNTSENKALVVNSFFNAMFPHAVALEISLVGFWIACFFIDRIFFEGIYLVAALAPVAYFINFENDENNPVGSTSTFEFNSTKPI